MDIEALSKVWPEYRIEGRIGKGSYGEVYRAVRRDEFGSASIVDHAAIKVISIPSDEAELNSLNFSGTDERAKREYYRQAVGDFVKEIEIMRSLKGTANTVGIDDYRIIEHRDSVGWDVVIRMELLTPLNEYLSGHPLGEKDVIRLGSDICTALDACERRNIIHRDIKPENIFVSPYGEFKLGDFGIARQLDGLTGGLSRNGTPNYMAPEVMNGQSYDRTADLYSLGVVLYQLLNGKRLPFVAVGKTLSPAEIQRALVYRLRGEPLPAACEASPQMQSLLQKACAFAPAARFSSAAELKRALEAVKNGNYSSSALRSGGAELSPADHQLLIERLSGTGPKEPEPAPEKKDGFKLAAWLLAGAIVLALLVGAFIAGRLFFGRSARSASADPTPAPVFTQAPDNTAEPPTDAPTAAPETPLPTYAPTALPTEPPTAVITDAPTEPPTAPPTVPPTQAPPTAPPTYVPGSVVFRDPRFEAAFRTSTGMTGPIMPADVLAITELDLFSYGLTDISDVAMFTNLTWLNLYSNDIRDISPIAALTQLTFLDLEENDIEDISALASLSQLTDLYINGNRISDIFPLTHLTRLRVLNIGDNRISDLSPLSHLSALVNLKIYQNGDIRDITPIFNLTSLEKLYISHGQFTEQQLNQLRSYIPGLEIRVW